MKLWLCCKYECFLHLNLKIYIGIFGVAIVNNAVLEAHFYVVSELCFLFNSHFKVNQQNQSL